MSQKNLHLFRFMMMMVGFHRQHCHADLFRDYLPPWSKKEKLVDGGNLHSAQQGFWLTADSQRGSW